MAVVRSIGVLLVLNLAGFLRFKIYIHLEENLQALGNWRTNGNPPSDKHVAKLSGRLQVNIHGVFFLVIFLGQEMN